MDAKTKDLATAVVATIATGFLLGAGFMLAQRVFRKRTPVAPTGNSSFSNADADGWLSPNEAGALNEIQNSRTLYMSSADGQQSPNDYGWNDNPHGASLTNFDFTTGQWR